MRTHADIAREALEILDRDGWAKGALTMIFNADYWDHGFSGAIDSHCIGGAVNIAISGHHDWLGTCYDEGFYEHLLETIITLFPEHAKACVPLTYCLSEDMRPYAIGTINTIVAWNNHPLTSEADVRIVLEKMAAG